MDIEDVLLWVVGLVVAFALTAAAFAVWSSWSEAQKPTFQLKRDEWACSKQEQRTHMQPLLVGKVLVPMQRTTMECVEWKKVEG